MVKVILDNGAVEILVTNLFDTCKYPQETFKELYFKRWGIETCYDTVKNKLQLEAFSGQKVTTIIQDFYITFFLSNLQQIISNPANQPGQTKKYHYKINKNVAFGLMKNRIVELFSAPEPEKILYGLQELFARYMEPVRPDRKYLRCKKFSRTNGKYYAITNYKRAI